jgi:hypothetical protein
MERVDAVLDAINGVFLALDDWGHRAPSDWESLPDWATDYVLENPQESVEKLADEILALASEPPERW